MSAKAEPTLNDRILGGLWGAVTGDALGVPVEFKSREDVRANPVTEMRGGGVHKQPLGTWSDDSSLMFCTIDSLLNGFDTTDMGQRFVKWFAKGLWSAHGEPFDIGVGTSNALLKIEGGTPAEEAGGWDEQSNGNGSLMRILPMSIWGWQTHHEQMLEYVHRASAITHRHARSQMACGFYSLMAGGLLTGLAPAEAYAFAIDEFKKAYGGEKWNHQFARFELILSGRIQHAPEDRIQSRGYVISTLEAGIWCVLTSNSFQEAVLKAVNLGFDTDTTGTVAGGLAGMHYGRSAIPPGWLGQIVRKEDLHALFGQFLAVALKIPPSPA